MFYRQLISNALALSENSLHLASFFHRERGRDENIIYKLILIIMKKTLLFILMIMLIGAVNAQVFISQNCDPRNNYAADRFAEIYNPTSDAIDLTGWTLENIQGGGVEFTWTLSGSIAAGEALICGNVDATGQTITPDITATWAGYSFNGKGGDGTILKNAAGDVVDNAVQVDATGMFENGQMVRNSNITTPNATYDAAEWTFSALDDAVDATPGTHTVDLVATDLFFSEYVEGSINGNNRIIEIFNGTGAEVDLSTYAVKQSHNGTGWGVDGIAYVLPLTGTLADGDVYVIANESADAAVIAVADITFAYGDEQGHKIPFFTGDDAMGLFKDDVLIDVIGVPETDPGTGWDVAGTTTATADHTLVRKGTVTEGNTDWAAAAGTDADDSEWVVFATDVTSFLGEHYFGEAPVETTYTITFNVDMSLVEGFDSSSDVVYIAGFPSWDEPGTNAELQLTDPDGNMTYTIVLEMDIPGGDIEYKFFINAGWNTWGEWDGGDNRTATITETTTLNHIFANQGEAIVLGVPFIQGFDYATASASISLAGWTNTNLATGGAVLWGGKEYSDEKYAQMSSYSSSSTGADEAWLITPGIDMDNSTGEELSFDVNIGYWNFAGLTVKISTDFDQTVAGISTATWTDVTADFTIPVEPTSTYGDFATAGHLDVSSYTGTMYVAFVYNGDAGAGETTTYQLDNVVVAEAGTVGLDDVLATELNIYPNPSHGKFFIQMGDAFKANTKVEVFNVVGMKVFETLATAYKTEIDLSAMKQGVYYVRVDDGQNIITQKVMKQ